MVDTTPKHPSVQTMLGSPDSTILEIAEQVYKGKHAIVPSVLSYKQQDKCMRELCQELAQCMDRASPRVRPGQLDPLQGAEDVPSAILSHGPVPPQLDLGGWKWPSD